MRNAIAVGAMLLAGCAAETDTVELQEDPDERVFPVWDQPEAEPLARDACLESFVFCKSIPLCDVVIDHGMTRCALCLGFCRKKDPYPPHLACERCGFWF